MLNRKIGGWAVVVSVAFAGPLLLLALGLLTFGTGVYFLFLRPAMLPKSAGVGMHPAPTRIRSGSAEIDEGIARAWSAHPRRFVVDAAF